jgi:hypothetical protein
MRVIHTEGATKRSQALASGGPSTDFSHVVFREFGVDIGWTSRRANLKRRAMSRFPSHISKVGFLISEKEMTGSDTLGIVAMMTDGKRAIGNGSMCQDPRQAGGDPSFPAYPQLSVPVIKATSCPQPTVIGLRYERPESSLYFSFTQGVHGYQCSTTHVGDR